MTSVSTADSVSDSTKTSPVEHKSNDEEPKLAALRSHMDRLGLDAYIVPTDDPHLSEYVPDAYMRRAFLTHFGGSAGTALVLKKNLYQQQCESAHTVDTDAKATDAFLWTDSRYFNEASLQLDPNYWSLMKQGLPKVPTLIQFLTDLAVSTYRNEKRTLRIGLDPFVHSASFVKELLDSLTTAATQLETEYESRTKEEGDRSSLPSCLGDIDTLDQEGNLVDLIWGEQRPAVPTSPFRVHPLKYAGRSVSEKIRIIQEQMKEKKATLSVFAALDDVAYLFNLRAKGDVDTCPVGIAYATIHVNDGATLFCDDVKVRSDSVQNHLKEAKVNIMPYDAIVTEMKDHLEKPLGSSDPPKIWLDKSRCNYALSRIIPTKNLLDAQNAITPMKACKNEMEMSGMRQAHIVDGAAMASFMAWLEQRVLIDKCPVSEVEIDEVLTGFRAQQPGFVELSFPTIAGVGSNGAIIHYRARNDSELLQYLDASNSPMILLDSGGQYEYGTTDVTRTWFLSDTNPDPEYMDNYTRVLKGNIGVDSMIFPENTPGFVLDVFARKALWKAGKDYGHGTGHGVGAALNVHEGPHSISPRWTNKEILKKGMVVSNEPGYYEDGKFGIRIENLLEITYVNDEDNVAYAKSLTGGDEGFPKKPSTQKTFLMFKKLTMIPIQKNLINIDLMTDEELDWLDEYHQEVFDKVSRLLQEGSPAMLWLKKSCTKIDRKRHR